MAAVTASEHDGNVPANAIDGNLGTRWSAEGDPEWLRFQLNGSFDAGTVKIAWSRGDQRRAAFDVEASTDGSSWTRVFTGEASGTTVRLEAYDLAGTRSGYVRIVGHGKRRLGLDQRGGDLGQPSWRPDQFTDQFTDQPTAGHRVQLRRDRGLRRRQ